MMEPLGLPAQPLDRYYVNFQFVCGLFLFFRSMNQLIATKKNYLFIWNHFLDRLNCITVSKPIIPNIESNKNSMNSLLSSSQHHNSAVFLQIWNHSRQNIQPIHFLDYDYFSYDFIIILCPFMWRTELIP